MELQEAIILLKNNFISDLKSQAWADLGCGSGLFTKALAHLLPAQSFIYAVDQKVSHLTALPDLYEGIEIKKRSGDFTKMSFPLGSLNGIVMANSLHYIKDQSDFLKSLTPFLHSSHLLLFVEYDTDIPNPWVPYPLSFASIEKLAIRTGYKSVQKLQEKPSAYQQANLYSAVLLKSEANLESEIKTTD